MIRKKPHAALQFHPVSYIPCVYLGPATWKCLPVVLLNNIICCKCRDSVRQRDNLNALNQTKTHIMRHDVYHLTIHGSSNSYSIEPRLYKSILAQFAIRYYSSKAQSSISKSNNKKVKLKKRSREFFGMPPIKSAIYPLYCIIF